ncbi:MAG: aminodeoxychorismate lyase [Lysobacter sp.]|nr:aminodeoxychorismate lyase [Lysobacter sp.]
MPSAVRVFVGDAPLEAGSDTVLAAGRGLAYGDGVFETMRACAGEVHWWPAHRARLARGAARLGIAMPSDDALDAALRDLLRDHPDAVAKLVLTRGSGGRGYAPPLDAPPMWLLSASALPPAPRDGGLVLRWCGLRLAPQPALAGIKHCNRLEQVLARAEWRDAGIDEGLLRDLDGDVVCATAANLFVLHEGRWWTPPVERCGVAGVCRGWALAALDATERRLTPGDVLSSQALVLCNAVRGILPVARLGDRTWSPHPAVGDVRRRLAGEHPAFSVIDRGRP